MPFVELKPGKGETVRMSQRKTGAIMLGFSAGVAERNRLGAGVKVRVLADLESKPRVLRLIVDPKGAFGVKPARGGAAFVQVGRLPGLEHVRFEKCEVEWEEDEDGDKRHMIDITLPTMLQASDLPQSKPAGALPAYGATHVVREQAKVQAAKPLDELDMKPVPRLAPSGRR